MTKRVRREELWGDEGGRKLFEGDEHTKVHFVFDLRWSKGGTNDTEVRYFEYEIGDDVASLAAFVDHFRSDSHVLGFSVDREGPFDLMCTLDGLALAGFPRVFLHSLCFLCDRLGREADSGVGFDAQRVTHVVVATSVSAAK